MTSMIDVPAKVHLPSALTIQMAGLVCSWCYQPTGKLQRCSQCQRVVYCSKRCQQADWKFCHKRTCEKFVLANKRDQALASKIPRDESISQVDRFILRHQFSPPHEGELGCQCASGGEQCCPEPYQYMSNEIICSHCGRTPFSFPTYRALSACSKCKLAWFCSDSESCRLGFEKDHPPNICQILCDVAVHEHIMIAWVISRKQDYRGFKLQSEGTEKMNTPVSSLQGWDGLFKALPTLELLLKCLASEFSHAHPRVKDGIRMLACDGFSIAFTLLAALERSIDNLRTRTKLTIHFVGAAGKELHAIGAMEEILHLLPKLKVLQLVYVGPEMVPLQTDFVRNRACFVCQPRGRTRTAIAWTGLYQDFVKTPQYKAHPPDIFAILNSGFSEVATASWYPTLKFILDSGVPAVLTSYSKPEASMELAIMRKLSARVIQEPSPNPWKGGSPSRPYPTPFGVEADEDWHVVYINHYRYMIQGYSKGVQ